MQRFDPEPPRCIMCDVRLKPGEDVQCDKCSATAELKAPAPTHILELHQRVATIIRKRYFIHTRNERLAHECAQEVLAEVTRTYEAVVAGATEEESNVN